MSTSEEAGVELLTGCWETGSTTADTEASDAPSTWCSLINGTEWRITENTLTKINNNNNNRFTALPLSLSLSSVILFGSSTDSPVHDLTMQTQVQWIASRGFAVLRRLCSIRRYVPKSMFRSLVTAVVLNRLDYCNSLLVDLPANLLQRLQSVQNSAAWLIYRLRRSEHITDALLSLHWLCARERVEYKVAVLTYKALNGLAPPYLSSAFTVVADLPSWRRRRPPTSCWCRPTSGQRSDGGRSPLLVHVSGTLFPLTLRLPPRWPSLDGV